jgi:hypothetical protein
MSRANEEVTEGVRGLKSEFCETCGCQKDEDSMFSRFCEICLEEWAEENEVYL